MAATYRKSRIEKFISRLEAESKSYADTDRVTALGTPNEYRAGLLDGYTDALKMAARWLKEEIETERPL